MNNDLYNKFQFQNHKNHNDNVQFQVITYLYIICVDLVLEFIIIEIQFQNF